MYLLSRLMVKALGVVTPLIHLPKPFSFVGPGASLSMTREIIGTGARRVLVITDAALFKLGLANPVIAELQAAGVTVEVFSEVQPDPGFELVMAGVAHVGRYQPDAVIAIGGGSPIDCAKAILLCHANACHPRTLKGLWLYALPRKRTLPFYVIPTTAGTGSEVTIIAIVSDNANHTKIPIIDPKMVPSMMALDPQLMVGLPGFITAPTGMDALTHAVEACISTLATDETDALALAAAASIVKNLPIAYSNGQDLEARERLAVASCMAGLAFTRAAVGYVHAFSHQLGGIYHIPHGLINAIVLPYVLEFSKSHCTRKLAKLARAAGLGKAESSDMELSDAFIALIRKMNRDMSIPGSIQQLQRSDFPTIIDRAFSEAHGTYGVPRYLSRAQAVALLEQFLPGA
ncbi:iron-containing alcohol dehydrogenase [Hydrogenophaga sp.]|uniref:iron-containing alcohol dehydrogenase n=1 Tax=Hydrogenophaga sp. TaxID=1904254 RepID=UPI00286EAA9B|nr:iron-containing alcohol dehydrogenase [Hydrogenophaga sp.]